MCEDFRSREQSWKFCRIALELFQDQKIPFWDMSNADVLVGNATHNNSRFCFARPGEIYLVYLPAGGTAQLDLAGESSGFSVGWLNPREGGELERAADVQGGAKVSLSAPSTDDWLAVIRKR
jgi:hypothetical protein